MNPMELFEKLDKCIAALGRGNIQLKQLALKKDNTENLYRIALRKEILKLKLEGQAATLINDLAKGEEKVARLRLEIECIRSRITWERVELKNS